MTLSSGGSSLDVAYRPLAWTPASRSLEPPPFSPSSSSTHPSPRLLWPPATGYPLRWFPDIVDSVFHCMRCHQCLRHPVELEPCSHLVCSACWQQSTDERARDGEGGGGGGSGEAPTTIARAVTDPLPSSSPPVCPLCAVPVTSSRLNRAIEAIISRWLLFCPYRERGCGHRCSLGRDEATLVAHLERCDFVPVPCRHCGQWVERRSQAAHEAAQCASRFQECEHCHVRVVRDEEQLRLHALNPVEPGLPCVNLRVCPNRCLTSTPTHSPTPSSPSARSGKRRRDDDGEAKQSGPMTGASNVLTMLPVWQLPGHLLVCLQQPLTCGLCSAAITRSSVVAHFESSHPRQPLVAKVEEQQKGHAEAASSRTPQPSNLADGRALPSTPTPQPSTSSSLPPSPAPYPTFAPTSTPITRPPPPLFSSTPVFASSPYLARLSTFETLLGALPCLHCGQLRSALSTPGSQRECVVASPQRADVDAGGPLLLLRPGAGQCGVSDAAAARVQHAAPQGGVPGVQRALPQHTGDECSAAEVVAARGLEC